MNGLATRAEGMRTLAYRLYTLCERQGWAEDARAYNTVITAWPAIEAMSTRAPQRPDTQTKMEPVSKTTTTMFKPWRELAPLPHEDVQRGTFQQAEFAADLSRVHAEQATSEYQDPELFYARTYVTEGMRVLLGGVVKRMLGQGGDPVIQLQTAFGGGKTHTLLAVYHMAQGKVPAHRIEGLKAVLQEGWG